MEQFRVIAVCALIFISCAGLGTAAFWSVTHTGEPLTVREIRMLVKALVTSALATWVLMIVAPARMLWAIGVFLMVYAALVAALLAITHYKITRNIKRSAERTSDE